MLPQFPSKNQRDPLDHRPPHYGVSTDWLLFKRITHCRPTDPSGSNLVATRIKKFSNFYTQFNQAACKIIKIWYEPNERFFF